MARLIAAVGLFMFIFVSTGTSETKKKNPYIAAVLSVVVPGVGQIYNGELVKAAGFFGMYAVGVSLDFIGEDEESSSLSTVGQIISIGSRACSALEAYMSANKINKGQEELFSIGFTRGIGVKLMCRF